MTITDQLRAILKSADASCYCIARETGIDKSAMSRFMNGGSITTTNLDKLGALFSIKIKAQSKGPSPLTRGRPPQ